VSGIHVIPSKAKFDGHAIRPALITPAGSFSLDSGDPAASQDVRNVATRHVRISHRLPGAPRNGVSPFFVHDVPDERPRGVVIEGFLHMGRIRRIDDSSSQENGEPADLSLTSHKPVAPAIVQKDRRQGPVDHLPAGYQRDTLPGVVGSLANSVAVGR